MRLFFTLCPESKLYSAGLIGARQKAWPVLRLKLDPWSADYGPSLQLDPAEAEAEVDVAMEGPWGAIEAGDAALPDSVVLIDGVRRMDLFLRWEDQVRSFPAAVGSLAVGALLLRPGNPQPLRQSLPEVVVEQLLLLAARTETEPPDLEGLRCVFVGDQQQELLAGLQEQMRMQEALLASRMCETYDLVIADGPLQNTHQLNDADVLGYIKSHHRPLLPASEMELVGQLKAGQRTPMFALGTSAYRRVSWYQRLEASLPGETVMAGVVRLEMLARSGLARAQLRARQVGALLPRLRNFRHRDPRAPQNLIPIAMLERVLKHRLGDPALVQRRLKSKLLGGPS